MKARKVPRHARIQAFEDKGGQWRLRVRAKNGRIVVPTESHPGSPSKVLRALEALVRALDEARKWPVEWAPRRGRTVPMPWGKSRPGR